MINVVNFTSDVRVWKILQTLGSIDEESIVEDLEKYKFVPRFTILKVLNKDRVKKVLNVDSVATEKDIPRDLRGLNSKEVVIESVSEVEKKVTVCYNYLREPDYREIENTYTEYSFEYVPITPFNLRELTLTKDEIAASMDEITVFKRLLMEAESLHSSELHFEVRHFSREASYVTGFRINGKAKLKDVFYINKDLNIRIVKGVIENLTFTRGADLDSNRGVKSKVIDALGDGNMDLRITSSSCYGGYVMIVRIQTPETATLRVDDLGFDSKITDILHVIETRDAGLTLLTGAQRTGKNTTAFAIGHTLAEKEELHILGVESPIELLMPFTQIDYGNSSERLVSTIELCKKMDTDMMFINEVPDVAVANAVKDLINSGVGVITTFHIDRFWHFPYKLYELYGDSFINVITQINAVITQKMYVHNCPKCRETFKREDLGDIRIEQFLAKYNVSFSTRGKGCEECNGTGYAKGVQPYAEGLLLTDAIKSELLKLKEPHKMEAYLKELLDNKRASLEYKLADGIIRGDLRIDCLYSIL